MIEIKDNIINFLEVKEKVCILEKKSEDFKYEFAMSKGEKLECIKNELTKKGLGEYLSDVESFYNMAHDVNVGNLCTHVLPKITEDGNKIQINVLMWNGTEKDKKIPYLPIRLFNEKDEEITSVKLEGVPKVKSGDLILFEGSADLEVEIDNAEALTAKL